jgi:tRNA dimethylallyltransferase
MHAVLIAGPTASGKSALAIRLAQRLGGTVINADSMQVYRDLRVLTARPTAAEESLVPHRLFGDVDGAANYSVGQWLAAATAAIAAAQAAGSLPILVGGTGLYFKALTMGLSDIPAVPKAVRERIRAQTEGLTPQALHARLAACDPLTAAGLRPTDPQRLLRALEVFAATGTPLAHFQATRAPPVLPPSRCTAFFLAAERSALRRRIDARFDAMMRGGALDEVAALAARRLSPLLPVMRAHGVPGLLAYLNGGCGLDAAVAQGKRDTSRYVKRQFTFARSQLAAFAWVAPDGAAETILRAVDDVEGQSP